MRDEKDTPGPIRPPDSPEGSDRGLFTSFEDFRTLVENLGVGFGIVDASETFLFANPTGERIFGVPPGGLAGRNVAQFVDGGTLERIGREMERRRRGETSTYEMEITRPDGGRRRILLTSAPHFGPGGELASTLGIFLDVTERVRTEEALRETEQRFFDLADLLPQTVFELDLEGRFIFANRHGLDLSGYTQEDIDRGIRVDEVFIPEERERIRENLVKRLRGESTENHEYTALRRDGTTFPVYVSASPIIRDGRPVGLRGIVTDVTSMKEAAEALRRSEERYRELVEKAGIAVVIDDLDGRFQYANRTFFEMSGYGEDELPDLSIGVFAHPDDLPLILDRHARRVRGEDVASRYRFRGIRKDGRTIHLEIDAAPVRRGDETVGTQWYVWDISEDIRMEQELRLHRDRLEDLVEDRTKAMQREVADRRRAEEALRESEAKFRAVVEQSRDGIYLADFETGGILEANPALRQLLGYTREELTGLTLFEVVAHGRDDILERIREVVEEGSHHIGERHWRRKDGILVDVEVSVDLISYGGRKVFCVVGRDVTERKSAEEERSRLQTQLLHSQKMEAIGILAGGIAHDFNNLLTTILGQTELALEMVEKEHAVFGHLEDAHQASIRAANLTRQLLLFSRRQPMDMARVNVNRTIDNLLKMLRRFIGEDVALRTDLDPGLWPVRADEGNMEQVIINLAVNARDAMPEGGALTIRTENVHIGQKETALDTEARAGRFVRISLEDTGSGMDPAVLQRIFEPFFSTKTAGKGTGLGLSVVYGIVKQHEGWIRVSSEFRRGTRFHVFLPALSGYSEEVPTEPESMKDFQGKGERILLVEDGVGVRNFATKALRKNGYTVFEAGSTAEALEVFEAEMETFDLVFSDVVLPDRTGIQLVDLLLSRTPELRVLLTSGYVDHKSQWPMIRERGFRFLQKPYTLFDLLSHIREVLEAG